MDDRVLLRRWERIVMVERPNQSLSIQKVPFSNSYTAELINDPLRLMRNPIWYSPSLSVVGPGRYPHGHTDNPRAVTIALPISYVGIRYNIEDNAEESMEREESDGGGVGHRNSHALDESWRSSHPFVFDQVLGTAYQRAQRQAVGTASTMLLCVPLATLPDEAV
ncbi:hypothetical protein EVAR_4064_1 [Eumeta japonica]|uniref:Uncharacterized protein n=1 Tax=Eumeta variegata TaxID=151549 RepID=A0A4C1T6I3_EUMVA|nr:hypothetical protein EVAR_4064_1 [Eumeta japonica]